MSALRAIMRRELGGYFRTPVAYVFMVIFLSLSGLMTFRLGHFFERGQADLLPFFEYHPWLYLFLIPAVSMRLWAEERKNGTIELLMTLPISTTQAVLGKFLAAWLFVTLSVALTFPIWIAVNYLGHPDNGVIAASYLGSLLMAGGFLAIGSCASAITRNQVIAFILAAVLCFIFLSSGLDATGQTLRDLGGDALVDALSSLSFAHHFKIISQGMIELRAVIFFASSISLALFINVLIIDLKKAD